MKIMEYVLENLEEKYELELGRITEEILRSQVAGRPQSGMTLVGPRSQEFRVLLQLPDGLKPWGPTIVDFIESKINRQGIRNQESGIRISVMIWLGDCFGACDLPDSGCDLVVQFGHSQW